MVVAQVGHMGEEAVSDPRTDDGCRIQHAPARLCQALDPGHHDLPQVVGHVIGPCSEKLFDEEGITARARRRRVHLGSFGPMAE